MLKLTPAEQAWLDGYRQTLAEDYPGLVDDILIFGSKARGDAGPDSDLDVLVVLTEADRRVKDDIGYLGYLLAVLSGAVPSILVYTKDEWAEREKDGSPFYGAVMRDGVRVA